MSKCPCHSNKRYADCCAPLHRGARKAESPEALMRSRYAAFALGDFAYIARTLSAGHPSRATSTDEYREARTGLRYVGLDILSSSTEGEVGEVLFYARVFERGRDRSIVELSGFVMEDGEWRYASGVTIDTPSLPADPRGLTRADVLAHG